MYKILRASFLFSVCFLVLSCTSNQSEPTITPMPSTYSDLSDQVLKDSVKQFLSERGAPAYSSYEFERVDLNSDGRREALVIMSLPHHYWCGWNGCSMIVFQPHADQFRAANIINGVRPPIYLLTSMTNGWRDIVIRVSGERMPDKNVVLKHDGAQYPNTPMLAENYDEPNNYNKVEKLFAVGRSIKNM